MERFINCVYKIVFGRTLAVVLMIALQILVLVGSFTYLGIKYPFVWETMNFFGGVVIIYIINRDEPPEFKLSWIIPLCLFPVFGALIYVFIVGNFGGIGLKKKFGRRVRETEGMLIRSEETEAAIQKCPEVFKGFAYYMENSAGFPVYHNSVARYYPLGEDKFADLIVELKKAEKYIFLEYFIIERGIMWDTILDILKEKVKEGVEVRVMYDGMCSILLLPYNYPKELESFGIKAKMFAPIVPFLSTTQNNRDHRKIVVIDGKTAFTGGVNLADEYINQVERFGHWKDVAVKVTGDAVRSFTIMYLQMWNVSEQGSENYEAYVKNIVYEEPLYHDGFVIPYGETPTRSTEVGKTVYQSMINGSTKYVHIMTPYFIVGREFLDCMRYAAHRGVEVAMILPHIPDKKVVYFIARTFYPELIQAGIKVYEYTPGFIHAKIFVSDDQCATVGTINLDYRSFYHHFECGAYFYDNSVVAKVEEDFQDTLLECQEITMDYYKKIPLYQKLIGRVSRFIAPLL
ncbi:MAG: cardiolipin synthase [Lachnospiraceae bacterium]|nr:cardiolipin synthase [Lachnospiraceae bacterium]